MALKTPNVRSARLPGRMEYSTPSRTATTDATKAIVLYRADISAPTRDTHLHPDARVRIYLVYLKYWTLNLMPLMVYPKVLFHPNFSIKALAGNSLSRKCPS